MRTFKTLRDMFYYDIFRRTVIRVEKETYIGSNVTSNIIIPKSESTLEEDFENGKLSKDEYIELMITKGFVVEEGGPVIDPIVQRLIDSSAWLLYSDMADGTDKGINSPLTNPLVDMVGSNDASLYNFVGTVGSGYEQFISPNGKTVTGLQPDVVDDYMKALDDYNPVGLDEFGFGLVIRAKSRQGTLFCKGPIGTAQILFGIGFVNRMPMRIGGAFILIPDVFPTNDTFYKLVIKRQSGILIVKVNNVEVYNEVNTRSISELPNTRIFSGNTDATGIEQEDFSDSALFAFSACPVNGNFTEWENAFDSFALDKYGL